MTRKSGLAGTPERARTRLTGSYAKTRPIMTLSSNPTGAIIRGGMLSLKRSALPILKRTRTITRIFGKVSMALSKALISLGYWLKQKPKDALDELPPIPSYPTEPFLTLVELGPKRTLWLFGSCNGPVGRFEFWTSSRVWDRSSPITLMSLDDDDMIRLSAISRTTG